MVTQREAEQEFLHSGRYFGVKGVSVSPDGNSILIWVAEPRAADAIPTEFAGATVQATLGGNPRMGQQH